MTASDRDDRRADKAELSRSITATETLAFMTALMAFLKEAEAAGHHGTIGGQPPPSEAPATPAHHHDPAAMDPAPGDHGSVAGDRPAAAALPTTEPATAPHADAAASSGIAHVDGTTDAASTAKDAIGGSAPAGSDVSETVDHGAVSQDSPAHAGAAISVATEPASLHQPGSTITNLVDSSLAAVSHTLDSLSTTVAQLTSTVTGTLGQLADGITGLAGDLLHSVTGASHDAPAHDLFDALVTDIVSSPLAPAHDDAAAHPLDSGGLDTAGAVPTAALSPLALHLGFLGQPTPDGHDLHDGAFSALGVHHF